MSDALRIALAIAFDTAALVIWNVGTRSPLRLIADMRSGLRHRATAVRGGIRFVTGAVALVLAATISIPVANRSLDLTVIESATLLTALVLEALIGAELRAQKR